MAGDLDKGKKLDVVDYALRELRNSLRNKVGDMNMANHVNDMLHHLPAEVKLALHDNIVQSMTPFGPVQA